MLSLSALSPSLPQFPLFPDLVLGFFFLLLISLVDYSQFHDFEYHKSVTI